MNVSSEVEWVSLGEAGADQECVDWTWADGSVDRLPGSAWEDDLPGEEVASLGVYVDGLGVGGYASRLHRIRPDLWLISTSALEEEFQLDAARGSQESVLSSWLLSAVAELGHSADLMAFVAGVLHGLLPDEIDAAAVADVVAPAEAVGSETYEGTDISWTGETMFLTLAADLTVPESLRRAALDGSPWIRQAVEGHPLATRLLQRRLRAWDELGA